MRLRTVALRSLGKRPARTIFSMLGIAMGIAIVVGIFTLDHNTLLGLKSPGDPDWKADVRVSPKTGLADPRAELEGMPGVESVAAFFQNDVDLHADEDAPPRRIRIFGLEFEAIAPEAFLRVDEGRAPEAGQALVGRALAESLGVAVGDTIVLERPRSGARKVCVDGRMEVVEAEKRLPERKRALVVSGLLAPEKLGRRTKGEVVVIGFAEAQDLFADVAGSVEYVLEKDPKTDVERLRSSLGRAFSFELNKDVLIGQAADERAFRNGVRFAGLMALGLGLYVIFHVLSIALVERSREIATLQALGATRAQVARVFLGEALLLAVGGGLLGLGGGILLARVLLALRITTLGAGRRIEVFEIPWATILPLALIGCGIALLGSIYPLLRLRKAEVARALRGDRHLERGGPGLGFRFFAVILVVVVLPLLFRAIVPVIGEKKEALELVLRIGLATFGLLLGLPLLVPGLLGRVAGLLLRGLGRLFPLGAIVGAREIGRRPLRLAVGAAVLAMVAAAYTALCGITGSLAAEIDGWAANAVADKVFVAGLNGLEVAKVEERLADVPGFAGLEKGDLRAYVPFLLQGLGRDALVEAGVLREAADVDRFMGGRGLVVSTRLARDQSLEVGGTVAIRTGRGSVEDFQVLAISDAVGFFPYPDERMHASVAEETMRRDFCLDPTHSDRLAIRFDDDTEPAERRRRVEAALTPLASKEVRPLAVEGDKVRRDALFDVRRDFVLFDVIVLLTAALGGLGVLNGQLLSALERSRELGILKALGASRRQMAGLVLIEALVIGLLGGILGAILGILLNPVLVEALQIVSAFDLPTVGVLPEAALAVLGSLAVSLLAALYPMWKVMRLPTTEAVR